jgi:type VI secretion system protein ImpL
MKKLFSWILHPWVLAVLGLLAISLLIWWVGPLISIAQWTPLASETVRWVLILGIIGIYVLLKAVGAWQARQRNKQVVSQLMAQGGAQAGAETGEVKQLRERFEAALKTLRNARFGAKGGVWSSLSWKFGRQYLYELPWYVIVGAPGAGKTTALLNSGLQFPLSDKLGRGAVKGIGGTRNCDWWFTDRAVLLDTAGRYTTHDSDPEADRKAWQGFLALLKKARPRRPINGVLLAVSMTDLLAFSAEQRAAHAASLRQRVRELHETLGVRMPVYVLLTKCDLLAGFMDYFADADKTERAQVWGTTFDYERSAGGTAIDAFGAEFDKLTARLLNGVLDRAQAERDPQRRARIYGFPQQFGGIRDALDELLRQTFEGSTFETTPLLRGVYFVSGTQEGTPIDRMLGAIARELRLERQILPPNQNSGRSFYLTRLLADVVFPEAELVGANLKWEARRRWLALAAYVALGAAGVLLLTAWVISYTANRSLLAQADTDVAEVRKIVDKTPPQVTTDLMPLLPALSAVRALRAAVAPADVPWAAGFGLYQGRRLGAAAEQAYEHVLNEGMLPRLATRFEQQLRTRGDNLDALYEALKVYVMLVTPEHFDGTALKQVVLEDWRTGLPVSTTPDQRATLEVHLEALLEAGAAGAPLREDKQLVQGVREQLRNVSLAQRVYTRLRLQGPGSDIPEFTIAKHGGATAPLVFVRASGAPLTKGVPGLYTYDGYHKGFQPAVDEVTKQLAEEEKWVLGTAETSSLRLLDPAVLQRLTNEVRRLYLNDYIVVWDNFIADIKLVKPASLQQSVQAARILSQPDNPLVPLTRAMVRETSLLGTDEPTATDKVIASATKGIREKAGRIFGNEATSAVLGGGARPERIVDEHFALLRQFAKSPQPNAPAPLDGAVALIGEIYNQLNAAQAAVQGGNLPPPSDPKASGDAARYPEPVRTLVKTLAASGTSATLGATKGNLGAQINAEIGQFCRKAIAGRYPLVRNSASDVTQDDFARLFAPGGLFDDFFQKNLKTMVDTSTRTWSFRQVGDVKLVDDAGSLVQFQRAAVIRDTFFRAGGRTPGLRLDFKPLLMDETITQFILDVDGQIVRYAHGPQIPTSIQWPGPKGSNQVRIQLSPTTGSGASGVVADGPWALFRLLDRMQIEPGAAPERFRVTFNVDGRRAVFEITANSVQNPFRLRELESFNCPGGL